MSSQLPHRQAYNCLSLIKCIHISRPLVSELIPSYKPCLPYMRATAVTVVVSNKVLVNCILSNKCGNRGLTQLNQNSTPCRILVYKHFILLHNIRILDCLMCISSNKLKNNPLPQLHNLKLKIKYLLASRLSIAFSDADLMYQFCLPYKKTQFKKTPAKIWFTAFNFQPFDDPPNLSKTEDFEARLSSSSLSEWCLLDLVLLDDIVIYNFRKHSKRTGLIIHKRPQNKYNNHTATSIHCKESCSCLSLTHHTARIARITLWHCFNAMNLWQNWRLHSGLMQKLQTPMLLAPTHPHSCLGPTAVYCAKYLSVCILQQTF